MHTWCYSEHMNLGNILEEFMGKSGFVRSTDRFIEGLNISIQVENGAFYFHRPRRKYDKCPICKKLVGRKSKFRYQVLIKTWAQKPDYVTINLHVSHRGNIHAKMDKHHHIGKYYTGIGEIYSVADPEFLNQVKNLLELWDICQNGT
jgi:hypothetical protein